MDLLLTWDDAAYDGLIIEVGRTPIPRVGKEPPGRRLLSV
jgi:hypothetical protein